MIKKVKFLVAVLFLISAKISAQSITGNLSQLANQEIKLEGLNGLKSYLISKTTTDEKGNFVLAYTKKDFGAGYLIATDNEPLLLLLSGEDIGLKGEALDYVETMKITKGVQNIAFETYTKEYTKQEQALSAWLYLEKMYQSDPLFSNHKLALQAIAKEKKRIYAEDAAFISSLPKNSYVSWFLPTRKLVSSVANVAQYRTEELPATIKAFRNLDYTDERLYKSGFFENAINNHFWLLENSGKSLDSVSIEMKVSIDAMMIHLVKDNKKLNEVTDHLFTVLERNSLFEASEYLAVKVLNEESCVLETALSNQLETYRAMKKGNTAPEMIFEKSFFAKPTQAVNKLSDFKSKYTLVAFGGSWCPKCTEELPQIATYYANWKAKDIEVLFVGVEENKESFAAFTANFPFPAYSDLKKWSSKIVTDYYVFSTPTLFLLNDKREIVLRPTSVAQVDAWVKNFLGE